jgi:2-methylcitrate dehydratase PrpD
VFFIVGLMVTFLAFTTAYKTQLTLFQESQHRAKEFSHVRWLNVTAALALLGIIAFAVGAFLGVSALAPAP